VITRSRAITNCALATCENAAPPANDFSPPEKGNCRGRARRRNWVCRLADAAELPGRRCWRSWRRQPAGPLVRRRMEWAMTRGSHSIRRSGRAHRDPRQSESDLRPRPLRIRKHGRSSASVAGKSKLAPKSDVIANPSFNISAKIIEIMEGYKARFDYFRPVKVDSLD
jgi:hypothetical protein